MPSLVNGVEFSGAPNRATAFVSFWQSSTSACPPPPRRIGRGSRALDGARPSAEQRRVEDVDDGGAVVGAPDPGVAEPHLRQQIERGRVGPVVGGGDHGTDVVGPGLGVVDLDVEKPVAVQDPGVGQFEFAVVAAPGRVLLAQSPVGILGLWVAVQPTHPGMGGRAVHRPPVLLDVLAVVALGVRQPEQPLLEDRVVPVPEGHTQVQEAEPVADAAESVLTPAVGPGHGLLERQVGPCIAVRRVVLADGAPLPTGQVGPPQPPRAVGRRGFGEPRVLGAPVFGWVGSGVAAGGTHITSLARTADGPAAGLRSPLPLRCTAGAELAPVP